MGFTFNAVHSDTMDICVRTDKSFYIPNAQTEKINIIGKQGQKVFTGGYDNIVIPISCNIIGTLEERALKAKEISTWLRTSGDLILDHDPDIIYKVVSAVNNIEGESGGYKLQIDTFTINFECSPIKIGSTPYTMLFASSEPLDELVLNQDGNYEAKPIITLDGTAASITIGTMTLTNISGITIVDCENMLVYSSPVITNKIDKFSGEFLTIPAGGTTITLTGSFTDLDISIDYSDTFI